MKNSFSGGRAMTRIAAALLFSVCCTAGYANPATAYSHVWITDWIGSIGQDIGITGAGNTSFSSGWDPVTGPGSHSESSNAGSFSIPFTVSQASADGNSSDGVQQYSQDVFEFHNYSTTATESVTVSFWADLLSTSTISDGAAQSASAYAYVAYLDSLSGYSFTVAAGAGIGGSVPSTSSWDGSGGMTYDIPAGDDEIVILQTAAGAKASSSVPGPAALLPFTFGIGFRRARKR